MGFCQLHPLCGEVWITLTWTSDNQGRKESSISPQVLLCLNKCSSLTKQGFLFFFFCPELQLPLLTSQ